LSWAALTTTGFELGSLAVFVNDYFVADKGDLDTTTARVAACGFKRGLKWFGVDGNAVFDSGDGSAAIFAWEDSAGKL